MCVPADARSRTSTSMIISPSWSPVRRSTCSSGTALRDGGQTWETAGHLPAPPVPPGKVILVIDPRTPTTELGRGRPALVS